MCLKSLLQNDTFTHTHTHTPVEYTGNLQRILKTHITNVKSVNKGEDKELFLPFLCNL